MIRMGDPGRHGYKTEPVAGRTTWPAAHFVYQGAAIPLTRCWIWVR